MSDSAETPQVLGHANIPDSAPKLSAKRSFANPRDLVADEALARALPQRLRRKKRLQQGFVLVILVPESSWLEPLQQACQRRFGRASADYYTGSRPHKFDASNDDTARKIADGQPVIVLGTFLEHLPPAVIAAATATVKMLPVDAGLVRKVMGRSMRGRVGSELDALPSLGLLDFDELCACIPKGGRSAEAINRLKSAVQVKVSVGGSSEVLPTLEEAAGYGQAARWGLDLKADIEDLRADRISWNDVDRGVVLFGPPGTGKTTFVKILGRSCGLPVIVSSIGELFAANGGYLNEYVKAIRALFERARATAPCILFIDELDALPNRAHLEGRNRDWWTTVVAEFLTMLDGAVSRREGVIVIGATNRIEDIDPALLRPGRLERAVYIGTPSPEDLARILRHYLGSDLADADLLPIAYARPGATGADATEWVRGARRLARRAGRNMRYEDLVAHAVPPDMRSEDELRRVATHEAGHACADVLTGRGTVQRVVLVQAGGSGGHTIYRSDDRNMNRDDLERITVGLLAGRAAELVFFGQASTGAGGTAESDLARATTIVASWRGAFGLADTISWRGPIESVHSLLTTDQQFLAAVEADLARLQQEAINFIEQNRPTVEAVAETLLEKRILLRAEIDAIISRSAVTPSSAMSQYRNARGK